jgi:hypothetical protein
MLFVACEIYNKFLSSALWPQGRTRNIQWGTLTDETEFLYHRE